MFIIASVDVFCRFGSAEATRRWEPVRFSHVAVDEHITDHALVVSDLISTRMTTSE